MNISLEIYCKHITEKKFVFPESQDRQRDIFKVHLVWALSRLTAPASKCLSRLILIFFLPPRGRQHSWAWQAPAGTHRGVWFSEHTGWDFAPFSSTWDNLVITKIQLRVTLSESDIIGDKLLNARHKGDASRCSWGLCAKPPFKPGSGAIQLYLRLFLKRKQLS